MRTDIQKDLIIELRSFNTKGKDINCGYSTGILFPLNIRNLTKIKILYEKEENKIVKSQNRRIKTMAMIMTLEQEI